MIAVIAAVAANGVIGRGGRIPWDIPEDRKHFRELTMGHTIVMGRRTYEEIGRPLPGRKTILLSSKLQVEGENCRTVPDFESLCRLLENERGRNIFICGGASLYKAFLPRADRMYLTEIHREVEGDVFFPVWDRAQWRTLSRKDREEFSFAAYEKKDRRQDKLMKLQK